jgi:hypothetical protein
MSFRADSDAIVQEELPFPCEEDAFRKAIEEALGKKISLTVTNNSTRMISVTTRGGCAEIRMHRMFLAAGPCVVDEIAAFICGSRRKTPLVNAFIRQHRGLLKEPQPTKRILRTTGTWHDLRDILARINAGYFENRVRADITWGVRTHRRSARRRTLGSYNGDSGTITINPVLDRRAVPRFFVEFIVYHEMLHADLGVKLKNGRRQVHTREFRSRERLFREFDRAIAWEKKWAAGR